MNGMKHSTHNAPARLVLTAVLLLGGHVAAGARTARAGWEVRVRAGRVVTLDGGRLRVRFVRVAEDSRCPEDVTCVWEGKAEVLFEVGGKSWGGKRSLKLHTSRGASEEGYGRYTVKLLALGPRPRSDRKIAPAQYTATLLVSKE